MSDSQIITVDRRQAPQLKRSFLLLDEQQALGTGPEIAVGLGFAFAFFLHAVGASGAEVIQVEAKDEQTGAWALFRELRISEVGDSDQLIEALSSVSRIRARVTTYVSGLITLSAEVLAVSPGLAAPGLPDWSQVANKPGTFPPSAHNHAWSEVSGKPDLALTETVEGLRVQVPRRRSDVAGQVGGLAGKLDALPSHGAQALQIGSIIEYFDAGANCFVTCQLRAGEEAQAAPWVVRPVDYPEAPAKAVWHLIAVRRPGAICIWNPDTAKFHQLMAVGASGAVTFDIDQVGFSLT
jgi:hypothetical protein